MIHLGVFITDDSMPVHCDLKQRQAETSFLLNEQLYTYLVNAGLVSLNDRILIQSVRLNELTDLQAIVEQELFDCAGDLDHYIRHLHMRLDDKIALTINALNNYPNTILLVDFVLISDTTVLVTLNLVKKDITCEL